MEVVPLVIDPLSTDLHLADTLVVMAALLVVVVALLAVAAALLVDTAALPALLLAHRTVVAVPLVVDPPVLTPDPHLYILLPALVSLLL